MSRVRKNAAPTDPSSLADQLHSAAIHLLRKLRRADSASGLNAPRLSALSVIVFAGPITLGHLAEAEQVRPPTMTRIVTALVDQGLVEKKGDPADRRTILLTATPRGRSLLLAGRDRRVASLTEALRALNAEDRAELAAALPILHDVLRRL